jgi:hypothetical protein
MSMVIKDKKAVRLVPLEDVESKALASYLDGLVTYKMIRCFSHIPNETSITHVGYLSKMKAMGKRRGVPDFIVVCTKKILFIEMKRQQNENGKSPSVVSEDQTKWIDNLNKINTESVIARVCYGHREAINFVTENI